MPPKSAPFVIRVQYARQKSREELQKLYADFYVSQVRSRIISSGLTETEQAEALARLIAACDKTAPGG